MLIEEIAQMSLPSRYAPEGLSVRDQKRTLTVGNTKCNRPIQYIIRDLEQRIENAYDTSGEDIEMIPVDNSEEVNLITHYIREKRTNNDFPSRWTH